ncbi:hypothetical protein [Thiomicrorhabdus heinhorstiae]|uniref:Uncharacterized protein n=1 Tax=Thiomicrorhabdus heinhorstiae TaxID=2748010 RepID=A0ABS0BYR9_9GAMM|nr:hypothetical protein [Thiomicrorhabdus heinhorstiae]MBF6058938.1 hypothetical protein [Thiomicrorhabdus heinhorstiae]
MKQLLFLIVFGLLSFSVKAEVVKVQGYVTDIWLFSKNYTTYDANDVGLANIHIDSPQLQPACGSGARRIAISTDHPLYSSVMSMALTAKSTHKKIEMWHLGKCTLRSTSWDFGLVRFLE